MKVSGNEILFIYNSLFFTDKRALGYVHSLGTHHVREWDVSREPLTPMQVKQLANHLNIQVFQLIDHGAPLYKKQINGQVSTEEELIQTISRMPELLNTPIALYEDRGVFVTDSFSLIKESFD